ncbi:ImuA family protein [Devosia sp.]|uniref:ImuA family protein n=1 Tax=Devosia sp. TaxID=1871048 RepID=UPI003A8F2D1A
MQRLDTQKLDQLRQQIAAIERRPLLADGAAMLAQKSKMSEPEGDPRLAALSVPGGHLHEVFADEPRASGASLGFALGLARPLLESGRRALLYLQLTEDVQEFGMPYGLGLATFGLDPDHLVICRVNTLPECLWAMEEAIACRAVAAVIADIPGQPKALDFTVSRRLGMRTAAAGTSAFLLRYGRAREASAARLRWQVTPIPSAGQRFDAAAPGPPRFAVSIEKHRLGSASKRAEGQRLTLDWTADGFVAVTPDQPAARPHQPAASPRPQPAALGDRLSQTG